jgi:hypothetical protein
MIKALAITAAGLTATVLLTVGLVASGSVVEPADQPVSGQVADSAAQVEPQVIYVKPAPKQKTIVVEKPARTTPVAASKPATRTRTVSSRSHDDDRYEREGDEYEREGHDD